MGTVEIKVILDDGSSTAFKRYRQMTSRALKQTLASQYGRLIGKFTIEDEEGTLEAVCDEFMLTAGSKYVVRLTFVNSSEAAASRKEYTGMKPCPRQ